jgi:hypothetical protein
MTGWVIGILVLIAVAVLIVVWGFRSRRSSRHRPSSRQTGGHDAGSLGERPRPLATKAAWRQSPGRSCLGRARHGLYASFQSMYQPMPTNHQI